MKVELTDRPYWTDVATKILEHVKSERANMLKEYYAKQDGKLLTRLFGRNEPDLFDKCNMYGMRVESLAEDLLISLNSKATNTIFLDGQEVSYLLHWAND
jgi:hypothetical protein